MSLACILSIYYYDNNYYNGKIEGTLASIKFGDLISVCHIYACVNYYWRVSAKKISLNLQIKNLAKVFRYKVLCIVVPEIANQILNIKL